jgi:DNA-binding response OmpR family regulator
MEKIILLMDNDKKFLRSMSQELAQAGYTVREASTIASAEDILCNDRIHLAIMDIHMESEYDEDSQDGVAAKVYYDPLDISGLLLAQDARFRALPKIILTKYPEVDYVVRALSPVPQGPPPAVDFVKKKKDDSAGKEKDSFVEKGKGSEIVIKAVDNAFARYVRLNWDLFIQFDENTPVTFLSIAEAIEPDMKGGDLVSRAGEIEDLFRSLFYGEAEGRVERIRIQRILWRRNARVALSVFVFPKNKATESRMVVCGRNSLVTSESSLYKDYSPKFHRSGGIILQNSSRTVHFAGNSYILADASLESMQSLAELYRGASDKAMSIALKSLYEKTLPEWHKNQPILADEQERLDDIYRERLNLTEEGMSQQRFAEIVQAIALQAHALGVRIETSEQTLSIGFESQTVSYPDPTFSVWGSFDIGRPAVLVNSPGNISMNNILIDNGENVWVTDFAAAGPVPLLWNYVTLEAEIRFDLVEPTKLQWLHDIERCLTGVDFYRFEFGDVEAPLRKPLRAIQSIRKLASKDLGADVSAYHLGILFHALRRLSEFNPDNRLTRGELTRYAHLFIGAAVILGRIGDRGKSVASSHSGAAGVSIDKENRIVRVDGARVPLRGQSYHLLCYLYDHIDHLITRHMLIEEVLKETYDASDESQASRLNTAMHRLREKIERDTERPQYLETQPGGGYRLNSSHKR